MAISSVAVQPSDPLSIPEVREMIVSLHKILKPLCPSYSAREQAISACQLMYNAVHRYETELQRTGQVAT